VRKSSTLPPLQQEKFRDFKIQQDHGRPVSPR